MRALRATLATILGLAALAACAYGAGSGGGSSTTQSKPLPSHCAYDIYATDCGQQPTANSIIGQPSAGPDNQPAPQQSEFSFADPQSPYDCKLYFETTSGITVAPNHLILGDVRGTCFGTGSPESVTTTLVLQWFSPRLGKSGEWANIPSSMEQIHTPPLRFPAVSEYQLYGYCTPGTYRIWGKVSGFDNRGVPFNPNTNPKYLSIGPGITFTAAQCAGGTK